MKHNKQTSERQKHFDRMLEEALSRPGVAEYMKVYQEWQKHDQELDSHRSTTKEIAGTSTTSHAN